MKPVSVRQMKRADRLAVERYGIPVLLLMDNAGRAVAEAARRFLGQRGRATVLSGGGHNGADGICAARYLQGWGHAVQVLWLKNPALWTGSLALHASMARKMGVRFRAFETFPVRRALAALQKSGVLIDALLGTGATGPLRPLMRGAIEMINAAKRPVISVDLPSGLEADTGRVRDIAVRATLTVTMAAPKLGLARPAARPYVGRLLTADIGIPIRLLAS